MQKGTWVEFTVDLSEYTNVYVQIYYSNSSAIRAIDDITLTTIDPTAPSISFTAPSALAYNATQGSFNYSITNPVSGVGLSATTDVDWISNVQVENNYVSFVTSVNTTTADRTGNITLEYEGAASRTVAITQGHLTVNAPTFSVDGGYYAEDQTVTITCTTEGASIYYTTDGTTPTASSSPYTSAVFLSEGQTTLKAIALKDGVSSAVTSATYTIGPNMPGSENNPYTVAQAIDSTPSSGLSDEVYVTGIVSRIKEIELVQYHNATYFISDDGTTAKELQVFRGKYIDNADFMSEYELQLGDRVMIKGKLKTYQGESELDQGNYLISIERDVEPVQFSPNSCMMSTDWSVVSLFSENAEEYPIYYTLDGTDPQASTTRILYDMYDETGGIITLPEGTPTIKAVAYTPDMGKSSNVTQATYNVVQPETPGLSDSPYTVAQALAVLDDPSAYTTGIYVKGTVFRIEEMEFERYNNATYSIIDEGNENDTLYVYRGRWFYGDPFTSEDDLHVGDKVTLFGNLIIYNKRVGNETIPVKELASRNYVMEQERPVSIIVGQNQILADCNATSGILNVTYNSIEFYNVTHAPQVRYYDDNDVEVAAPAWLTISLSESTEWRDLEFSINANEGDEPRTARLKVVGCDSNNEEVFSNLVTITQSKFQLDYASLPFAYVGNETETPIGITKSGVGIYTSSSPYLKFDNTDDYMVLKINEVPGELTFDIKGNSFSGGVFKVQASADGITWTDMASYDALASTTTRKSISTLPSTTRYIKWIYAVKSKGNVALGNINLAKPDGTEVEYYCSINGALQQRTTTVSVPVSLGAVDDLQGYHFIGWTRDPNNVENIVDASETFLLQQTATFYAVYAEAESSERYTRVFVDNPAGDIVINGPSVIPAGYVLDLGSNSITNTLDASKLLIKEGGQLVAGNPVDATMRKAINPYSDDKDNYYFISSPVANLNPATANMTGNSYDLYYFDQSGSDEWINHKPGNFSLETGKGYLYANNYGGNITMAGQMTSSVEPLTLTKNDQVPFAGWHLIGNPYPCNVTIDMPFYRLAPGGAALATTATSNSVAIAPMEGVFVQTAGQSSTVSFTKAPQASTTGGGSKTLSLRVMRNRGDHLVVEDNAVVRFDGGSMLGKLVLDQNRSRMFMTQEGRDYAIVSVDADGASNTSTIDVNFKAAENGVYTITAELEALELDYLHLIDNKTGADVDLLSVGDRGSASAMTTEGVSYTFTAKTSDYASRFRLVFSKPADETSADDQPFAYYANGEIRIVADASNATLQIVDVMGRVVVSTGGHTRCVPTAGMTSGVYVLRLVRGDEVKIQKVVLR